MWSRETGSAVPSCVSLVISILRLNLVLLLTGRLPIPAVASIYIYRTPSLQPRVDRVLQLCTDVVHCRESTGTESVVPKVVSVTGAAFAGHHGHINVRLSFPHTLLIRSGLDLSIGGIVDIR